MARCVQAAVVVGLVQAPTLLWASPQTKTSGGIHCLCCQYGCCGLLSTSETGGRASLACMPVEFVAHWYLPLA